MSVTAVPLQPVKTSSKVWLWLGILAGVLLAVGLAWMGTREAVAAKGDEAAYLAWNASRIGVRTTPSGLQYQVVKRGEGPNAKDGDQATVSIEGKLRDGTIFQPRAGGPFPVQAYDPQRPVAIPGFLEALKLMNKGSHYRVWLPAKLAYDAIPQGGPPELKGQMLMFDIEMTELQSAAEVQMQQMMQQQMMQRQMEEMQRQQGGQGAPTPEGAPKSEPKQ